jgi:hypothetical protein
MAYDEYGQITLVPVADGHGNIKPHPAVILSPSDPPSQDEGHQNCGIQGISARERRITFTKCSHASVSVAKSRLSTSFPRSK